MGCGVAKGGERWCELPGKQGSEEVRLAGVVSNQDMQGRLTCGRRESRFLFVWGLVRCSEGPKKLAGWGCAPEMGGRAESVPPGGRLID